MENKKYIITCRVEYSCFSGVHNVMDKYYFDTEPTDDDIETFKREIIEHSEKNSINKISNIVDVRIKVLENYASRNIKEL